MLSDTRVTRVCRGYFQVIGKKNFFFFFYSAFTNLADQDARMANSFYGTNRTVSWEEINKKHFQRLNQMRILKISVVVLQHTTSKRFVEVLLRVQGRKALYYVFQWKGCIFTLTILKPTDPVK